MAELSVRLEQRKVFLIGLHGQCQTFHGHLQKFFFELTHHDGGALHQGRDFLYQLVVAQYFFCLLII